MIKVESDMLVLDSSFTKEDVEAINHFVEIAKKHEREKLVELIKKEFSECECDHPWDHFILSLGEDRD